MFFRCIVCGKTGEGDADPERSPVSWTPRGWIAFLAGHWPDGIDVGPLVLRLCSTCYVEALTRSL